MYFMSFLGGTFIGMIVMYFRLKEGDDFILKRKDINDRDF